MTPKTAHYCIYCSDKFIGEIDPKNLDGTRFYQLKGVCYRCGLLEKLFNGDIPMDAHPELANLRGILKKILNLKENDSGRVCSSCYGDMYVGGDWYVGLDLEFIILGGYDKKFNKNKRYRDKLISETKKLYNCISTIEELLGQKND